MPRGVYPRRPKQLEAAKRNLALGRSPEARAKATESLRTIAKDPAWRSRVSSGVTAAMRRPDVRAKHLAGLESARTTHGPNFKHGNGQPPGPVPAALARLLGPAGFVPEYVIRTKGHGTEHRPPMHYKADLAHPEHRIVLEIDGPVHRPHSMRAVDQRKTDVLTALGWLVVRVPHSSSAPVPS